MVVLYRKYRPQKLSDLVGQDHVKKTILAQLESGKISHAYLFTGPKGTGKTTTARILAKAVNCLSHMAYGKSQKTMGNKPQAISKFAEPCNQCDSCTAILQDAHLDVMEIDAASNRGIDDVRNLRESIKLVPVRGRFKVYIVDEAHMLTNEAFNAFLKTLEEPPPHAIFILATTAPEKMPATIVSRCQRFNFFPATIAQITQSLKKVADSENQSLSFDILTKIAEKSSGSYRDGLVLLEKILAADTLDGKTLDALLFGVDFKIFVQLTQKLAKKDAKGAISLLNEQIFQGVSAQAINSEFIQFLRNLLFAKVGVTDGLINTNTENAKVLQDVAKVFSQAEILELLQLFETAAKEKNSPIAQLPAELAIAQFCLPREA